MNPLDLTGLTPADADLLRQLAERMKAPTRPDAKTVTDRIARSDEALKALAELGRNITHVVEFDRGEIYDRDTP